MGFAGFAVYCVVYYGFRVCGRSPVHLFMEITMSLCLPCAAGSVLCVGVYAGCGGTEGAGSLGAVEGWWAGLSVTLCRWRHDIVVR